MKKNLQSIDAQSVQVIRAKTEGEKNWYHCNPDKKTRKWNSRKKGPLNEY